MQKKLQKTKNNLANLHAVLGHQQGKEPMKQPEEEGGRETSSEAWPSSPDGSEKKRKGGVACSIVSLCPIFSSANTGPVSWPLCCGSVAPPSPTPPRGPAHPPTPRKNEREQAEETGGVSLPLSLSPPHPLVSLAFARLCEQRHAVRRADPTRESTTRSSEQTREGIVVVVGVVASNQTKPTNHGDGAGQREASSFFKAAANSVGRSRTRSGTYTPGVHGLDARAPVRPCASSRTRAECVVMTSRRPRPCASGCPAVRSSVQAVQGRGKGEGRKGRG